MPQDIADSTSDQEKKRQECLNEVFYTERDFVRDMEYLRDVRLHRIDAFLRRRLTAPFLSLQSWIKPLRAGNIIPEERREDFVTQVFWNVLEIHAVNVRLAEMLNKRQKQAHVVDKIGDIFLEMVPHFAPFVKYGAHQLYGKYEFEKEKAANPVFAKFVDVRRPPLPPVPRLWSLNPSGDVRRRRSGNRNRASSSLTATSRSRRPVSLDTLFSSRHASSTPPRITPTSSSFPRSSNSCASSSPRSTSRRARARTGSTSPNSTSSLCLRTERRLYVSIPHVHFAANGES